MLPKNHSGTKSSNEMTPIDALHSGCLPKDENGERE